MCRNRTQKGSSSKRATSPYPAGLNNGERWVREESNVGYLRVRLILLGPRIVLPLGERFDCGHWA